MLNKLTRSFFRDFCFFCVGAGFGMVFLHQAIGKPAGLKHKVVSRYQKLNVFASVLSYVENEYVDPVPGEKLIYGAIRGMLGELDPYSVFISSRQYQEMKAETSGEYGGPGLELSRKGKYIVVISPLSSSPAKKAGILAGDKLLQIGRIPLKGKDLLQVRRLLRGRPGTRVQLWMHRKGWKRPKQFSLVREQIRTQSVEGHMLEKGYYLLQIKSFQDRTERQMKKLLESAKKRGRIKGVVLDLRNNPGGLFDQSVRVADLFLEKGLIVLTRNRDPKKVEKELAHKKGTWKGFPIVVLTNRGTASAAEIVTGALQDHARAVILGQRSFGKGLVQTIIDLADGSGLKLTISRYFTPFERVIQGRGNRPDVGLKRFGKKDNQMKAALRLLKEPSKYQKSLGRGLPAKFRRKK